MSRSQAPRCDGSNSVQSIEPPDSWAEGTHKPCTYCGARAKFRVRETDRPPWARIMPHRTDGTPTR